MGDRETQKLRETIQSVVAKIQRFKDRSLGEQNTKSTLIEPILEALGWDVRDPDEVYREYKPTSRDCPVDYALALVHDLKLFVEAKGLGGDLSDRRWIGQILGYATVAGVEWCVLTDGDVYRFYNATAAVDAEEKLFFTIKLSEGNEDEALKTFSLISRDNLGENILNLLWSTHFVDRRVKDCLRKMVESRDKGLMRLIRKRSPKLKPNEIAQSLRRLEMRIESPNVTLNAAKSGKKSRLPGTVNKKLSEAGRKAAKTREAQAGIKLSDIVAAKCVQTPVRLTRKYRGQEFEATLRPDGKVEFDGEVFESCSRAAGVARGKVTGQPMSTNGWAFWQFVGSDGKNRTLGDARQQLLDMRAKGSG
jgi:hypothetical protein